MIYINKVDNKGYCFSGEENKEYVFLQAGNIRVTMRFGLNDGASFPNRVSVYTSDHTVQVSHEEILVDGKAPLEEHKVPGGWVWVEPTGVAVGVDGWTFGIVLDDGSADVHKGGPLEGVRHVQVFPHAPISPNYFGLAAEGFDGCDAGKFEV